MKNRPPNVFVSSTMYDLSELRAQPGQFIGALGWQAMMSEHDSFPIDPDQSTAENCRRNVRENADIFVMAVGARYGSIDAESDKSVTNLEFAEARARGVPVYVFVRKDVLAQLQMWKASPDAVYSSIVDKPRIFEFIDSLYSGGETWVSGFETAQDIVDVLSRQFAYLVQDALEIRQLARGQDRLLAELQGKALMIALQREPYWEYRLFVNVLEEELERRAALRKDIEHHLTSEHAGHVSNADLRSWVADRWHESTQLQNTITVIFDALPPQALGKDAQSSDPIEIAQVARRLAQAWEDTARWTLRCRAVRVNEQVQRLIDLLSEINVTTMDVLWEYGHVTPSLIDEIIRAPDSRESVLRKLRTHLTAHSVDQGNHEELVEENNRLQKEGII